MKGFKKIYGIFFLLLFIALFIFFKSLVYNSILHKYAAQYAPELTKMQLYYNKAVKKIPAERLKEKLPHINHYIIQANNKSSDKKMNCIINFYKDWHIIAAFASDREFMQNQQLLAFTRDQLTNDIKLNSYTILPHGSKILFKNNHFFANGLAYSAVGFRADDFLRQKKYLNKIALIIFISLTSLFLIIMFLPFKKILPVKKQGDSFKIKGKEASSFSKELQSAPVSESKIKNSIKDSGDKFFKEAYLNKNKKRDAEQNKSQARSAAPSAAVNKNTTEQLPRSFEEIYNYKKNLEQQIDELSVLREINLASNSINDVNDFFKTILQIINAQFEADSIEIYLTARDKREILKLKAGMEGDKVVFYSDDDPRQKEINLHIGEEGKALSKYTGVILNNNKNSILTVPLTDKNKITGCLKLISSQVNMYNESDKFILNKLARHIAVSINNVTLYESAITDSMTGLYVFQHLQNVLKEEMERCRRYEENIALAIFDIDHFKGFNDTHGHQAGDYILKKFAQIIQDSIRNTDTAFRQGGEEFAVIFLKNSSRSAESACEKIRDKV
ncbi:MAG TPA: sensor domain-containing diguanylate cyclase, partial [Spirochaetota bacterium]|nr:sensor domain-containing diguanylate cyclase [Spirochaetota bacterium]